MDLKILLLIIIMTVTGSTFGDDYYSFRVQFSLK